jgi:UDP-glucose 4-epimerase
VIGIDNLALGRRENLSAALRHSQFSFGQFDINEIDKCLPYLRKELARAGTTTVWHLAANSDIQAGGRDPDIDLRLTFLSTYNVLKLMAQSGLRELVFASSSAIYGEHAGLLKEDSGPLLPISNYGAMKLASEGVITAAIGGGVLRRAWICRFPNVVGSRATHGVIFDFLKKLRANPKNLEVLGDGTQEKPYLHVCELVEAMVFIHKRSTEVLNCYNIAPRKGTTTVRHIAEHVVQSAAPGSIIRYAGGSRGWVGDVPRFRYSTAKLKALGWSSKLTSNAAVELAIRENLSARP